MSAVPAPDGRFFCEHCLGRFNTGGDCPACPDEPLLDLGDEAVREMLISFDEKARNKRYGLLLIISAVLATPVYYFVSFYSGMLGGIAAAALFAAGLVFVLSRVFRAKKKLPDLSNDEIRRFESTP
jgi:hypothetical protein